jgi:ATPase subunit of ABC transporter with duplicated ATPase domains
MDLMIRLDNISKQNGHQILFIDASMGVQKGEKVGLFGPNGPASPRCSG